MYTGCWNVSRQFISPKFNRFWHNSRFCDVYVLLSIFWGLLRLKQHYSFWREETFVSHYCIDPLPHFLCQELPSYAQTIQIFMLDKREKLLVHRRGRSYQWGPLRLRQLSSFQFQTLVDDFFLILPTFDSVLTCAEWVELVWRKGSYILWLEDILGPIIRSTLT